MKCVLICSFIVTYHYSSSGNCGENCLFDFTLGAFRDLYTIRRDALLMFYSFVLLRDGTELGIM